MTIVAADRMTLLNERSAQQRRVRAAFRRSLADGTLSLADCLTDPPAELAHVAIIDVVRMARCSSRRGAAAPEWLVRMGRAAVRDGINLMMPLDRASTATVTWVAEYAEWGRRSKGYSPGRKGARA